MSETGNRGLGIALQVVGILLVVATIIACLAYGAHALDQGLDPLEKASLKRQVRLVGSLPMLGGIGLFLWGRRMARKRQEPK